MKTKKLLILLILFSPNLFISCTEEENEFNDIEDFLIDGVWKLESTEVVYYHDDELYSSEVSYNETDSERLTFNKDYSVVYECSFITIDLIGNWELNEDETSLFTDLSFNPSSSSGYGISYFFPQNKIIEINRSMMLLETIRRTYYLHSEDPITKLKITYYNRSTFIKE